MTNKTIEQVSNPELDINKANEKIRRLETALKDNENKFVEAQSIANFGFWELDPVTLKSTWTEGIYNIVGLEPNEALSYFVLREIIHPLNRDLFYNAKQSVIATGEDAEFDIRMLRPDKSIIYLHIIAKPKKDKNGIIVGVKGTAQDITYLKKIESDLKKSEIFYRTLFENTGTASILIDEDTTVLKSNTQFENLSGYSKDELECIKSWKDMVLKEDLETLEKYHYMRRSNMETPENYEAQLIDKRGNIHIVLVNVSMIPGTKQSISSLTDLTERKKIERELADSERRYRYMVEKATAGMFILDKDGVIKYLNEYMAQILNFTKNEMLESHINCFIDEQDDFLRSRKPLENQIEQYNYFKFLDKEGNIFWTNLIVSPIFNSKKENTGLLGIVTDINIHKGLEETFLEREEIFTDIIYDMMEMLNKIANEKNKSELSIDKDSDNN